jgi:hypothetical protein
MEAPSPEHCNLWLARAFNAQERRPRSTIPRPADPSWAVEAPPCTE